MAVTSSPALDAAQAFATTGTLAALEPFPGGHIHESHLVAFRHGGGTLRFLLQRLNTDVFPAPADVMANIERVTAHLTRSLARRRVLDLERRTLTLVHTRAGAAWHADRDGRVWRLYQFIEGTVARQAPRDGAEAESAAAAFGAFQRLLADLPGPPLLATIPDFHDTPRRLEALEHAIAGDPLGRVGDVREEITAIRGARRIGSALLEAKAVGAIPERVTHNDAKMSNLLFDAQTGEGLCVVDLDTVMPGLSLYDFGDLVRSMATRAAEDERNLSLVNVDQDLVVAIARGYLREAGEMLNARERTLLITAARVIVLEQGARFLTDHLEGDRYYRITRPGQNLDRARTQGTLLAALDRNAAELERRVARL